jgi:hypothetical protein
MHKAVLEKGATIGALDAGDVGAKVELHDHGIHDLFAPSRALAVAPV